MRSFKPAVLLLCSVFCLLIAGCTAATPVPVISGGEVPKSPTKDPIPTEDPPDNTSIPSVEFDSDSLRSVPPQDILQQVAYYGGGGWGESECPDQTLQIFRNDDLQTAPGCTIAMYACGWQDQEDVTITTIYPDGKQISSMVQASPNPNAFNQNPLVEVAYSLDVTDPAGDYTFIFQGNSGTLEHRVRVLQPRGARAYRVDEGVLLKGFSAKERIRFFVYQLDGIGNATLAGWVGFQADDHGEKRVVINDPQIRNGFLTEYFYVVVGDQAGQLYILEPITCQDSTFGYLDAVVKDTDTVSDTCGNMESRLLNGQSAHVAYSDGNEMRVRSTPGLSGDVAQKVPEGTQFSILDGPQCVDGITWWRVQTAEGYKGWMAEYSDGVYLLEP